MVNQKGYRFIFQAKSYIEFHLAIYFGESSKKHVHTRMIQSFTAQDIITKTNYQDNQITFKKQWR